MTSVRHIIRAAAMPAILLLSALVSSCRYEAGPTPLEVAIADEVRRVNPEVETFNVVSITLLDTVTLGAELDRREKLFRSKLKAEQRLHDKYVEKRMPTNAAKRARLAQQTQDILDDLAACRTANAARLDSCIYFVILFNGNGYTRDGAFIPDTRFRASVSTSLKIYNMMPPKDGNIYRGMGVCIPGYLDMLASHRFADEKKDGGDGPSATDDETIFSSSADVQRKAPSAPDVRTQDRDAAGMRKAGEDPSKNEEAAALRIQKARKDSLKRAEAERERIEAARESARRDSLEKVMRENDRLAAARRSAEDSLKRAEAEHRKAVKEQKETERRAGRETEARERKAREDSLKAERRIRIERDAECARLDREAASAARQAAKDSAAARKAALKEQRRSERATIAAEDRQDRQEELARQRERREAAARLKQAEHRQKKMQRARERNDERTLERLGREEFMLKYGLKRPEPVHVAPDPFTIGTVALLVLLLVTAAAVIVRHLSRDEKRRPEKHGSKRMDGVDMGTGVLWADRNVGAYGPYEDGDYFAFRETRTKEFFDESSYSPGKGGERLSCGKGWRVPTEEEFRSLIEHCECTREDRGNRHGIILKSRINGNELFLPAAGIAHGGQAKDVEEKGGYWTDSEPGQENMAKAALFGNSVQMESWQKCDGLSVRPVRDI